MGNTLILQFPEFLLQKAEEQVGARTYPLPQRLSIEAGVWASGPEGARSRASRLREVSSTALQGRTPSFLSFPTEVLRDPFPYPFNYSAVVVEESQALFLVTLVCGYCSWQRQRHLHNQTAQHWQQPPEECEHGAAISNTEAHSIYLFTLKNIYCY